MCNSARQSKRRVRGAPDSEQCMSGVAPDCPVPDKDKASNGRQLPNSNGWVTWLAHRQCPVCPSTAALPNGLLVVEGYKYPPTTTTSSIQVWCAHRQQPSPTTCWWLRAINTPNHHHLKHPRFLSITFNTRALAFTPRHNSKDQSLSKSQIQLKHLVTCVREILCSFELLPLGLPSSFLICFLK
jgi:hypothetical protein